MVYNILKYKQGLDNDTIEKLKILIQSHLSKLLVPIQEEKDTANEDIKSIVSNSESIKELQINLAKDKSNAEDK